VTAPREDKGLARARQPPPSVKTLGTTTFKCVCVCRTLSQMLDKEPEGHIKSARWRSTSGHAKTGITDQLSNYSLGENDAGRPDDWGVP